MDVNNDFSLSKKFEERRYKFDKGDLTLIRVCDSKDQANEDQSNLLRRLFNMSPRWIACHEELDATENGFVSFHKVFNDDFDASTQEIEDKLKEGYPNARIAYSERYEAYLVDEKATPII